MTMATTTTTIDAKVPFRSGHTRVLVVLAAMTQEHLLSLLSNLSAAFPDEEVLVASSDAFPESSPTQMRWVTVPAREAIWTLTASDFMIASKLAGEYEARAILMLGSDGASMASSALRGLADAVLFSSVDLAVSCYELPAHSGLANSAILYPLTRSLFASRVRFPLAVDLGLSPRMAGRLGEVAQRVISINNGEAILWPTNEAAVAGFVVVQFNAGLRVQAAGPDLNTMLPLVTGSLFSDIETKAVFWQRFRSLPPSSVKVQELPFVDTPADIGRMVQAFQLAYANLQEIWSFVLPPTSLLALKRLSITDEVGFRINDHLWARIVYDFLLAFRLRTINRGHLLGSLIPLYLAWVVSHLNICASGTDPEIHIEAVAAAFETEKVYMVSRWRWPDRFNS